MVDRVLFGPWSAADTATAMERAGKSGWSLIPNGFYDLLAYFPDDVLATDCSAFDWTYPAWVIDPIIDVKLEQMGSLPDGYATAVRTRITEVLGVNCTLRLPDGQRLRQLVPGIMKSGWFLTINLNSDAQDMLTTLAYRRAYGSECPLLWAMGDDVLMRWPQGQDSAPLVQQLRRAGILSKFATPSREFSGFAVKRTGSDIAVNPLYPNKHKYLLAHTSATDLEEVITSFGMIYALAEPDVKAWLEPLLRQYSRWPQSSFRAWAHGLLSHAPLLQTGDAAGSFGLE
ncbi:hypothetical protein 2 [Hubei sobemo-like virus 5]|uniref:hypothetical protein 2 n=1 Tax=Hubei sobemo-like virus 5 TaxID=1923238 RepID=UPI00090A5CFB|nr:hypothetical protein 2 [Hubei sobemo-like virus 5]APG75852.1 hypothetical protein 2 [Hubei sobemo-like virus 5]